MGVVPKEGRSLCQRQVVRLNPGKETVREKDCGRRPAISLPPPGRKFLESSGERGLGQDLQSLRDSRSPPPAATGRKNFAGQGKACDHGPPLFRSQNSDLPFGKFFDANLRPEGPGGCAAGGQGFEQRSPAVLEKFAIFKIRSFRKRSASPAPKLSKRPWLEKKREAPQKSTSLSGREE